MTFINFKSWLISLHACNDAVRWVGVASLDYAWHNCERGDWMLWLTQNLKVPPELEVAALAQCLIKVLPQHIDHLREHRQIDVLREIAWIAANITHRNSIYDMHEAIKNRSSETAFRALAMYRKIDFTKPDNWGYPELTIEAFYHYVLKSPKNDSAYPLLCLARAVQEKMVVLEQCNPQREKAVLETLHDCAWILREEIPFSIIKAAHKKVA